MAQLKTTLNHANLYFLESKASALGIFFGLQKYLIVYDSVHIMIYTTGIATRGKSCQKFSNNLVLP